MQARPSRKPNNQNFDDGLQFASLLQILEIKGFIPKTEMGATTDIRDALKDVAGEHNGKLFVLSQFDLNPATRNIDIDKLKDIIRQRMLVAERGEHQTILLPIHNGAIHFVVLEIEITPQGSISIRLIDSKDQVTSGTRFTANEAILAMAREAAKKAQDAAAGNVSGVDRSLRSSSLYTRKQKANMDCPYHVVQYILKESVKKAPRDIKADGECDEDFNKAKVEILKRIARAQDKNKLIEHIKFDRELGVPYLDNHPGLAEKRAELLRENEGTLLTAGGKQIFDEVSAIIQSGKYSKDMNTQKRDLGDKYTVFRHQLSSIARKGTDQEMVFDTLARTAANELAEAREKTLRRTRENLAALRKHAPQPKFKNAWEQMIATIPNAGKTASTVEYGPEGSRFFVTHAQVKTLDEQLADQLRQCKTDSEVDAVLATNIFQARR